MLQLRGGTRNVLQEVPAYQASQAPVGPHLADQLMIPLALAAMNESGGQFWATELTGHSRTNAQVIKQFLPVRFEMRELEDGVVVAIDKTA